MSELLEPRLSPALKRLQRFWLWKRSELVREVQQHVQAADAHTTRLSDDCSAFQADLVKKNAEQSQLQSAHQALSAGHVQLQSAHAAQDARLNEYSAALERLSAERAQLRDDAAKLCQEFDGLTARHEALQTQQERTGEALSQSHLTQQALADARQQLLLEHATLVQRFARRDAEYQHLSTVHECQSAELVALSQTQAQLQFAYDDLTGRYETLQTQQEKTTEALSQSQSTHQTLASVHQQLQAEHGALVQRLAKRDSQYQHLSIVHKGQSAKLATLEGENTQLQSTYDNLRVRHKTLQTQQEEMTEALSQSHSIHKTLTSVHQQLQTEHEALGQRSAKCDADYQQLSDAHGNQSTHLATLSETHAQLQSEHIDLMCANELVQDRYDLVCSILSYEPADNPELQHLKEWLAEEFVQVVQMLELPAVATTHALAQAQAIAQRVELLADAPALRDKFLVAVAGGFSTGKSSFVSSFMDREAAMLLPTGINPVTAIPTYVMPGKSLIIEGHTFKGAHKPLTPETYGRLTHDFISEMGFNVKEIMPYVVLQSPMPKLKHIAFIDMPGYNSAESYVVDTAADLEIASAALTDADAVIWLLGLDSSGTLANDDIEFLLDNADASKPLYVVLNKADLRSISDVRKVVLQIQKMLESTGIAYKGISAYSARLGKELFHHGERLEDVLAQWDHHSSAAAAVHKEFESLMDGLETASEAQRSNMQRANTLFKSLQLDFYELSAGREADTEASFQKPSGENMESRTQRVRLEVEDKLQRLARTLSIESNDVTQVLENSREHGHELLRHSCGAGNPSVVVARAHWEH